MDAYRDIIVHDIPSGVSITHTTLKPAKLLDYRQTPVGVDCRLAIFTKSGGDVG
jgi:hypothetical protein